MATLNHTNLTTYNVPGLKEFFRSVFAFQILDERGDKFAVLRNSEGFLLTLMYDKHMTPEQAFKQGYEAIGVMRNGTLMKNYKTGKEIIVPDHR